MSLDLSSLLKPETPVVAENPPEKRKKLSPFDYVNSINRGNNISLDSDDPESVKKDYNAWIVNKAFSMHRDTIGAANMMNRCHAAPGWAQYLFLLNTVRPVNRRGPWYKSTKSEVIDLLMEVGKMSYRKAEQAARVITPSDIDRLKSSNNKGGMK